HGWPFLEFSRNAASEKIGHVSLPAFVAMQFAVMGYTPAPFWFAGVVYLLVGRPLRHQRALGWAFVAIAAILAASGSARPHYLAAALPVACAGGAVMIETWRRRWRWVPAAAALGTAAMMLVSLPIAMPLLSPAATIRYQSALGITPPV